MSTAKRKILYLITKGNFGGAQRYVFDLATSVPKNEFEVVVAFGEGGILGKKLQTAGIRTIEISTLKRDVSPLLDFKTFFELIRIYRKEKPHVVHLNSSKIGGLGALAGRIVGVPRIIFTGHGWAWNEDRPLPAKALIALIYWFTMICCHSVIAVSHKVAAQVARFPFISHKIKVVHNGIAPFDLKDGFEARQKIGPTIQHSMWIGTISELHKNKGLDYLIEAFSRTSSEYPDCGLVIIGEGEERKNLERLVQQKDLQGKVHMPGFIDQANAYLRAFDIFTLTSRTEAFPYVLLEAGMAGLPVLASRIGGIPEVVEDGKSGTLVESGAVKEIAKQLSMLLENTNLRDTYGKNLKQTIEKRFSQAEMVRKTVMVYN